MSAMEKPKPTAMKEYIVRVPKNSRKKYSMMRFHKGNAVEFNNWSVAKMERENNYKEYKSAEDDQPKFGAGSEFGREQRDEARRKRYGINIKKYKPDNQPWLLSIKDKKPANPPQPAGKTLQATGKASTVMPEKKFKGIREGGVSDNVSWYVFLQAKDGAFEAYPVEEWYNFQSINRYKCLNAEEAEEEFEKRDKIVNYFSVMIQKKRRKDDDEEGGDGEDSNKVASPSKKLMLSEMDDWMSDKESDDEEEDDDAEKGESKKPKKKIKAAKHHKAKQGGKRKRTEDGDSGTDCEEESDEFDEGAEHEYEDEDSSDPEHEDEEKVTKEMAGVEEGKALKKLLNSDDEDEDDEEQQDKNKEDKQDSEEEKKKKKDSSADDSDSSDDERQKQKDPKKAGNSSGNGERNSDVLKRKMVDNPDGIMMPASKKGRSDTTTPSPVLPSDSGMFEDQIRRYLARKPMTTTEILQKLKNKKTGHSSQQLVDIIAVMLKKINPQKRRVKGKMYLSLKTLNG